MWSGSSWWSLFAIELKCSRQFGYVGADDQHPGPWLEHIILPGLALALQFAADIARQLRTSLVAVLDQNYIVGARVRGLPKRRILIRHALRNAAGPALVILGYDFPIMLAARWRSRSSSPCPGSASWLSAASDRDIPVVQGVLLVVATFVDRRSICSSTRCSWLDRSADGMKLMRNGGR